MLRFCESEEDADKRVAGERKETATTTRAEGRRHQAQSQALSQCGMMRPTLTCRQTGELSEQPLRPAVPSKSATKRLFDTANRCAIKAVHETGRRVTDRRQHTLRVSVNCDAVRAAGASSREDGGVASRRQLLLYRPLSAFLVSAALSPPPSVAAPAFLESSAGSVFGAGFDLDAALKPGDHPKIKSPGLSWSLSRKDKQLFYPVWMEGEWEVRAEFDGAYTPLGRRFTDASTPGFTKASILAVADVGATPVVYRARFMRDGAEGGVVADREFNVASSVNAFLGRNDAVKQVDYKPLENPTRYSVIYSTPRRDSKGQAEDLRKAECFINNRVSRLLSSTSETSDDDGGLQTFLCAEFQRQVQQAARQGSVNDYVVGLRLEQTREGGLRGLQRVAAFLQPQDAAYFDVGGQAVAVYDYKLQYNRI